MVEKFSKFLLFFVIIFPIIQVSGNQERYYRSRQFYHSVLNDNDLPVCSYSHLLMLYPNTDVVYVKDGISHKYTGSLSGSHKNAIISAYNNLHFLIADGSANMEYSLLDIVVINTPISKITSLGGNMYYLSSDDIKDDLITYAPPGIFDSVHVVWNNGPIDSYWGLGGMFINGGKTTFDSMISGQEWWWTTALSKIILTPSNTIANGQEFVVQSSQYYGQVFLHEWLHGVCRYYASLGFTMPIGDADGGESHGYKYDPVLGWMNYYRDLMQGKVWEPAYSKYTGITKEAWSRGTPNQTPLKITSPNGGEEWKEGESHNITWVHLGQTGFVWIDLLKNGVFETNLGIAPVEDRIFPWTILIGLADRKSYSDYRIRISNNSGQDMSDNNFTIVPFSSEVYFWLRISTTAGGTTIPSPGNYRYREGGIVNITALPNINYRFTNWSGDASGTSNPITILMDRDKTIKANFIRQYSLTIEADAGGTTTPSPGTYKYDTGTTAQVTAVPNIYYIFNNWTGAATSTSNPISLLMTKDYSIKANFRLIEPPPNFSGQKVLNRSLSQAEYINVLSWAENPNNAGLAIAKYRIYQVDGGSRSQIAEVSPNVFQYQQRKVLADKTYTYEVVVVLEDGREGKPASVTFK